MTIKTGIRPRAKVERIAMAKALLNAPRVVALTSPDDGWQAACLRISGRVPVWANDADPVPTERLLRRLGLAGLGSEQPGGTLSADLKMARQAPIGAGTLPPVRGPLISVVICTFNRAQLVRGAIRSALAQSWPVEIIVVDDGSTDETERVLASIAGIRVIRKRNGGKPSALAAALKHVRGDAVLVLDDDDLIMPGALNVLGTALFERDERVAVWGDAILINERGDSILGERPGVRYPPELMRTAILAQIPATTGATLMRTTAVEAVGGYDQRLIRGEDMDLFLRLSAIGEMISVPFPTFLLRVHDGVRGVAGDQWRKSDRKRDSIKFLSYTKSAYREQWSSSDHAKSGRRREGFAWALGLHQRDLLQESKSEASRWKPPFSRSECWIRGQLGLSSVIAHNDRKLVVVDDGDPGALEATLLIHGDNADIFVDLEVPRDPLGEVRLHWQGEYVAQCDLRSWLAGMDGVYLRLSSSPDWSPPPLPSVDYLPEIPAHLAVRAAASALGWPQPSGNRRGIYAGHPVLTAALNIRESIGDRDYKLGLESLRELLLLSPGWLGAWSLASEFFSAIGDEERASVWRDRVQRHSRLAS